MRCDRASFVGRFRCDRPATGNGRCEVHNHPLHVNAPHYSTLRKPKGAVHQWTVTNQRTGEVRSSEGRNGFDAVRRAFPGHYVQTSSVDPTSYKAECLPTGTVVHYTRSQWCK